MRILFLMMATLAASSAANAKQDFEQVLIPIPQGHYSEALALNSQDQALIYECPPIGPASCNVLLWTQKGGFHLVHSFISVFGIFYDVYFLNDRGQVATIRPVESPSGGLVFSVWSEKDGWQDLAAAPPGSAIISLNNAGVIIGVSGGRIFSVTRGSGVQFIGDPLPATALISASNGWGVLTGRMDVAAPWPGAAPLTQAFRWTPSGGLQDIDTREYRGYGIDSVGLATNTRGDVAGVLYTPSQHPFLWTEKDGLRDLGSAFGRLNTVLLNDRRDVVGGYYIGGVRSYVWTEAGGFRELGYLENEGSGANNTYARDLNNRGEVAGFSGSHAFYWSDKTGVIDLGRGRAERINDRGLILGYDGAGVPCIWTR
jgi:hypothetical protein